MRLCMLRGMLLPALTGPTWTSVARAVISVPVPVPSVAARMMALPITPKTWVHFSILLAARADCAPGGIGGAGMKPRTMNLN